MLSIAICYIFLLPLPHPCTGRRFLASYLNLCSGEGLSGQVSISHCIDKAPIHPLRVTLSVRIHCEDPSAIPHHLLLTIGFCGERSQVSTRRFPIRGEGPVASPHRFAFGTRL